jgi:hypothetical protein
VSRPAVLLRCPVEKKNLTTLEGWQFETFEVLPGLFLSKRLVEPHDFASLGVDAIMALDHVVPARAGESSLRPLPHR